MNIQDLIKPANQSGDFFGAWPDPVQGREDVTNHPRRFWEPRMRRQIIEYVRAQGGAGLNSIVIEAIGQLEPMGAGA